MKTGRQDENEIRRLLTQANLPRYQINVKQQQNRLFTRTFTVLVRILFRQ